MECKFSPYEVAKMNAVVYARYSSHSQTEQSIEGQLRDCHAFAEREGYTVVHEYIDRALTGRSDDRPQFQRMITDAAKRQFQFIIVWKLDRFARNRFDSATYKARLKKHGVRVISATENISDSPEGIMMEGMLESMAEYYSANLAQNVRRGLHQNALNGAYTGGVIPIGYRVIDKKLVVDDEKARHVRYAFEQYASGVPKKEILIELNAKGLRNGVGKPLTPSSLQRVFKNAKYIGINIYNGTEVKGGCPPIIDKELFQKVQVRLSAAKRAPAASKAKIRYTLQGKAYCGMCGSRLVGESGKGRHGAVYHYYACALRKKEHNCTKKNEKKDFLEWYVVEQTLEYVLEPTRLSFIADRIVEEYEKEFDDRRLRELERLVAKYEREIDQAVDASIEVDSPSIRARYFEKIELLEAKKADAEHDLTQFRIANKIRYTKEEVVSWMKTFCKGDLLDQEFRSQIIDVFVNSVYVWDDKIVMYYNVQDSQQVSYIEMVDSLDEHGTESLSEDEVRISERLAHQIDY